MRPSICFLPRRVVRPRRGAAACASLARWAGVAATALLPLLASTAHAGAEPVVHFAPFYEYVQEATPSIAVPVAISSAATGSVGVAYTTADGSAHAGSDYVAKSGFLSWSAGDASTKNIFLNIINDDVPETYEQFDLILTSGDGVTVGKPDTATVYIFDDDTIIVPTVSFVVPPGLPTNTFGYHLLYGDATVGLDLPVRVFNVTSWPFTVPYTIAGDPQTHEMVFQQDEFEKPIPVPGIEVPAGQVATARLVSLGQRAKRGGSSFSDIVALLADPRTGTQSSLECLWGFICLMLVDVDYNYCGFGGNTSSPGAGGAGGTTGVAASDRAGSTDPTTTLQRYRDEILAPTPVGQYYIRLYKQLSLDAEAAAVRQPTFVFETISAPQEWVAGLGALVDGAGDGLVISQQMVDDLYSVVTTLGGNGPQRSLTP